MIQRTRDHDPRDDRSDRDDSDGANPDAARGVRRRDAEVPREETARLPRPREKKTTWPALLIWIVPLLVAVGAGYYFYKIWLQRGPVVAITFNDVSGLKTGEAPVTVHGVRVGTVEAVDLAPNGHQAVVQVRFHRDTGNVAKSGTVFWMVRPDISGGNITGLGTLISGPYIEAVPGEGEPASTFTGLDSPPLMVGDGVRVILHASRIEKVQLNSPVYYRGIQVGVVQDIRLSSDSTQANATLFIWKRFAPLLHTDSVFWPIDPTEVKGDVFNGVQVRLGSLRSFLGSGLTFATPENTDGKQAVDGAQFTVHSVPKDEWYQWTPRIQLPPDDAAANDPTGGQVGLRSAVRVR